MWDETDASNLRNFLASTTGQRLKELVKAGEPVINSDGIEKAALSSQRLLQFKAMIEGVRAASEFINLLPDKSPFLQIDQV